MKSFRRYLREVAAANNASFASGGSSPATKFSGIAGFGGVGSDTPAANKPGKGDGKDTSPEITATIDAGVKRNSIVKDKETGALQFRGLDGTLFNSPHAAIEGSRDAIIADAISRKIPYPQVAADEITALLKNNRYIITYDSNGKPIKGERNLSDAENRDWWPTWDDMLPDWFNDPSDDIAPRPGDDTLKPQHPNPFPEPRKPGDLPGIMDPNQDWNPWGLSPRGPLFDILNDIFESWDQSVGQNERLRDNWDNRYDDLKPYEWKKWQEQHGTPPPGPPQPPFNDPIDPVENPPGSGQWWHWQPGGENGIGLPFFGPNHQDQGWWPSFPPFHENMDNPYYNPPTESIPPAKP
mgnify:CR=1 FL=1